MKRPIVIAHRGASGYLPEHTLQSVAMAHGFDVDYIEPDIVLTKDDQAIVLHDIYLDKTTNVASIFPKRKRADGRYYAIDFTLEEVKRLNAFERQGEDGNRYPARFPFQKSTFKVPSLDEYLELIKGMNTSRKKKIGVYIEFKNPDFHAKEGKNIMGVMMETLDRHGFLWGNEKIYIQCFVPKYLKEIKAKYGDRIKLIQLIAENAWGESEVDYDQMKTAEGIKEVASYADGIGPWIYQLLRPSGEKTDYQITELNQLAKNHQLEIHPYTYRIDELPPFVSSGEELLDLLFQKLRVDGVFSDFPDKVKQYLDRHHHD